MPQLTPRSLALMAVGLLAACSSSSADPEPYKGPAEFVEPPSPDEAPMGKFLADFDNSMRYWTNLMLGARSEAQRRDARQLEAIMGMQSVRRFDELVVELETGPARNRQRAAAALGFSRDRAALAPLVGALDDPDADVVHNALLGLTLLGFADTAPGPVVALMVDSPDPETRSNAAYALRTFVEAGQDPSPYMGAIRSALNDPSGGVRVQCALVTGLAADAPAVEKLGDMLHSSEPLVTHAAIEALKLIGSEDDRSKGTVARLLVNRWRKADRALQPRLRLAMIQLAGIDFGEDSEPWIEWAQKLP
ncbi:MAG TPA: HEAT repeat domain-containing protein [Planctomycetota bacterium]|nr:HEAT repeat domain-containing protein [Planctomycetota bacterium]